MARVRKQRLRRPSLASSQVKCSAGSAYKNPPIMCPILSTVRLGGQVCRPRPKWCQMGVSFGGSCFGWGFHLAARVSDGGFAWWLEFVLGGCILGSKINNNNYLLQLPENLQLQPSIDPTLHQQVNMQLQLQLQLQRRTTVHWPTRVHQDGSILSGTDIA